MNLDNAPKTKAEWKAYIQALIDTSDVAVERALLAIYNNHSPLEKLARKPLTYDGLGFNRVDAQFLMPVAETVQAGYHLIPSVIEEVRPRIRRYWYQLMRISKQNLKEQARKAEENKSKMDLRVKIDKNGYVPEYKHASDAGMDIRSAEDVTIEPGQSVMLHTGVHVEIPVGYVGLQFIRSGLGSKGLTQRHAVGVIDSGYRGEILCPIWNTTDEPWQILQGMRVCQLVISPYEHCNIVEVDELSESDRGTNGYGSTGVM